MKPTIEEIMNTPNWGRLHPWKGRGKNPVTSRRAFLMMKYYPGELSRLVRKMRRYENLSKFVRKFLKKDLTNEY